MKNVALCSSGSDKEAILDLITSRSNAQRQDIITAYKSSFGKVQEHFFFYNFFLTLTTNVKTQPQI